MRRDRRPGPIKSGPTASNSRANNREGLANWVSVDPSAGGEPTSSIPDFSDNNNLPVDGVWYRYDGNSTLDDNPSASGEYISASSSGLTCYLKRNDVSDAFWDATYNAAGRFVTPLMRPDGTPLQWDDQFGIEFLCIQTSAPDSTGAKEAGITFGIGDESLYKTVTNNQVASYFLSTWWRSEDAVGLAFQAGGPGATAGAQAGNDNALSTYACIPGFWTDDGQTADTNVISYFIEAFFMDSSKRRINSYSGTSTTQGITPDYASDPMVDNKVHLFVAPTWNDDGGASDDASTVTISGWKIFYRLRYTSDKRHPDFVPGRVNNHSGLSQAAY